MNAEPALQALLDAIAQRNTDAALALADADPSLLSQRSAAGVSALTWAAYMSLSDLVAALRQRRGRPDFFEALILGETDVVESALAAGQDVNQLAPDGFTPLGLAVFFHHDGLALRLLEAGADVNAQANNAQRVAALHAAVARGNAAMVEELLKRGATVDLPQQQGVTPLQGAAGAGRADLVDLLRRAGADPHRLDDAGRDAAAHALAHGHAELARALTG
ncbi:ankyrin repeat domain-containing protein [Roseateles sp. NT4]|uniref:ankyrin repeat domain-containing protein n=1 Tax=Roseateles sp. NT4 TaxID=3453715 RepID=UPI003EEE4801